MATVRRIPISLVIDGVLSKGYIELSGSTTTFLRSDGTQNIPPGSAGGVTDDTKADIVVVGGGGVGATWTVVADAITYAKMQNVSATDMLLGRSTAGAGNVEEIPCTAAGRALIDDANAAAQLTTLGISAFAQTILDDANAAAVRTTIGAGTGDGTVTSVTGTAPIVSSGGATPAISLTITKDTWTPVLTFATPGDLSVAYSVQVAHRIVLDDIVLIAVRVETSTFTHTTAAGALRITGAPNAATAAGAGWVGALDWQGITKANYTDVAARLAAGNTIVDFIASGSGQAKGLVTAADMPTGGTVMLDFVIIYRK